MQAVKNLNNAQRNMLDKLYTERFNQREQEILQERQVGFAKLRQEVIEEVSNTRAVKALLNAGNKFVELLQEQRDNLREQGFEIDGVNIYDRISGVKLKYAYSNSDNHPKLQKFNEETRDIKQKLSNKRLEMRTRIYGMTTTYEQITKDLDALLKDI